MSRGVSGFQVVLDEGQLIAANLFELHAQREIVSVHGVHGFLGGSTSKRLNGKLNIGKRLQEFDLLADLIVRAEDGRDAKAKVMRDASVE